MSNIVSLFPERRDPDDRWQALANIAYMLDGEDDFVRSVEIACLVALEHFPEPKDSTADFEAFAVNAFLISILRTLNPKPDPNDTHLGGAA
jgi:hypothetical protein